MVRPGSDRHRDARLVGDAVRQFSLLTGFPVSFGGLAEAGTITVSTVVGARGSSLVGLTVRSGRGLGGRALTERRPRIANDYGASTQITHDYDGQVLAEGIRTLIAVPVVVRGQTRCVLYGGVHVDGRVGDVALKPAISIAESLAREFEYRDEMTSRLDAAERQLGELRESMAQTAERELLRATYAELRQITSGVEDEAVRERLTALQNRLVGLGSACGAAEASGIHLSPRELDVLSHIALGRTNGEIAEALGLTESTVKSYLSSAMTKLGSKTRYHAVAAARRGGLVL